MIIPCRLEKKLKSGHSVHYYFGHEGQTKLDILGRKMLHHYTRYSLYALCCFFTASNLWVLLIQHARAKWVCILRICVFKANCKQKLYQNVCVYTQSWEWGWNNSWHSPVYEGYTENNSTTTPVLRNACTSCPCLCNSRCGSDWGFVLVYPVLALIEELPGAQARKDITSPERTLIWMISTVLNIETFLGVKCNRNVWYIHPPMFSFVSLPEAFLLQSLHYYSVVSLIVALQAIKAFLQPCLTLPQLLHLVQYHVQAWALAPL